MQFDWWKIAAAGAAGSFVGFTGWSIALDYPLDTREAREWVGALSGYVAAVGALVAAWLTLGPLHRQVSEAKRQTDFVTGDTHPEVEVFEVDGKLNVRINNWNRRAFDIRRLTIEGRAKDWFQYGRIGKPKGVNVIWNDFDIQDPFPPYQVIPWRDRSGPVSYVHIIFEKPDSKPTPKMTVEINVRIDGRLVGGENEEIRVDGRGRYAVR